MDKRRETKAKREIAGKGLNNHARDNGFPVVPDVDAQTLWWPSGEEE